MLTETDVQRMDRSNTNFTTKAPDREEQPYPDLPPVVFCNLKQTSPLRRFCIQAVFSPFFNCISILVILINCGFQGFIQTCNEKHTVQEILVDFVYAFFIVEKLIKIVALGFSVYIQYKWHTFDVFIFCVESLDFILSSFGLHLDLRFVMTPMRLISRIEGMRKMVSMLVGILPMLVNVLMLYLMVIYIFGVVGVQLWAGQLLNRCFLGTDIAEMYNMTLSPYYVSVPGERAPFICSSSSNGGMRHCRDIPPLRARGNTCTLAAPHQYSPLTNGSGCVNWNVYYNVCRTGDHNPNMGAVNFDNIGYAMIAVFQAVTLEGWTDIMYYVMDSHSFWSFIYFIILTVMGSFVIMNTVAVVIATHFSDAVATESGGLHPGVMSVSRLWCMFRSWLMKIYSSLHERWSPRWNWGNKMPVKARYWSPAHTKLEELVKGNIFNRGIMVAIVLNILTMAVEHHNQPKEMTQVLYICNIVFTALFVLEMILKLMVFQWHYFQDKANNFDFAIVIISLWELASKSDSRLSVFRAFRVMRFGKLVQFLPYLKRQLLVLKRTMEEAAILCWLLMFGIYLFSLVGMHLFGCEFQRSAIVGSRSKIGDMIDHRKNFDSLLWSMVTVFEVLTLEDWNFALYNGMASVSPWASLYFIAIIVLGKNVVLNILVGIVVESFQNQPQEAKQDPQSDSATVSVNDPVQANQRPSSKKPGTSIETQVEQLEGPAANADVVSVTWMESVKLWFKSHRDWALYVLSQENRCRRVLLQLVSHKLFDIAILILILLNCACIAMERPGILPDSLERKILDISSNVFTIFFTLEMLLKILALGLIIGKGSYCHSPWNLLDGVLVITSLSDIFIMGWTSGATNSLGVLKILRVLRTLRPLRMIKRSPKLRLAVEALMSSIKPMGNIVLICSLFFFLYAILGVQLFKGKFYQCVGENVTGIFNKSDCLSVNYRWVRNEYNFDDMIQALIAVFVMYSKDGWVNLMYDGLDAVGVDLQPVTNYNQWMLIYFISFILMSFILLDMFIGVMVETFHHCQRQQRLARTTRVAQAVDTKVHPMIHIETSSKLAGPNMHLPILRNTGTRRNIVLQEPEQYLGNSMIQGAIKTICTSTTMERIITATILLSIFAMGAEHYQQPQYISTILESISYVITAMLVLEVSLKLYAFGFLKYLKVGWNILDMAVVLVSLLTVAMNQMKLIHKSPINPGVFRVVRVLRLAQVFKTKRIRVLVNTIIRTLAQVGNISLLFMFFFFIYAALGVELFGKLECTPLSVCLGLHRHTNFKHFGMALLTLYKVSTGDNWSGILKDTMRGCRPGNSECLSYLTWVSPIYFFTFVVVVQFVLVNLVVAAIMQALEDSNREAKKEVPKQFPEHIPEDLILPYPYNSEDP